MPRVQVGRYELNYLDEGQGTPVVFIHGLAGDLSAWTPQMQALKSRYRVISFDNRGQAKARRSMSRSARAIWLVTPSV